MEKLFDDVMKIHVEELMEDEDYEYFRSTYNEFIENPLWDIIRKSIELRDKN